MPAVVLSAASGARALGDAGRVAVAAAVRRIDRAAALALAGAGVGAVAAGLPLAPVVAEYAIFSAALLAGFARGAGGRFVAASMFKICIVVTCKAIFFFTAWASNTYPMVSGLLISHRRRRKIRKNLEILTVLASSANPIKRSQRLCIVRRRCLRRHPRQKIQQQHGSKDRDPKSFLQSHSPSETKDRFLRLARTPKV